MIDLSSVSTYETFEAAAEAAAEAEKRERRAMPLDERPTLLEILRTLRDPAAKKPSRDLTNS